MKISSLAGAAIAATLALSASAQAASWDVVADFSSSNPSGVWSYGFDGGSGFTPYDVFTAGCVTGVDCWTYSLSNYSGVPEVAANTTAGTVGYATVLQPTNVLNVHPGATSADRSGGTDLDSIVRFTAPTAGSYSYTGFFQILDYVAPNGVNISAGSFASSLPGTYGATSNFSGSVYLLAGGTIDFRVNRAGDYYYDSTGLAATVSNVPEPESWALMIAGFGMVGFAARRRRTAVAA